MLREAGEPALQLYALMVCALVKKSDLITSQFDSTVIHNQAIQYTELDVPQVARRAVFQKLLQSPQC